MSRQHLELPQDGARMRVGELDALIASSNCALFFGVSFGGLTAKSCG